MVEIKKSDRVKLNFGDRELGIVRNVGNFGYASVVGDSGRMIMVALKKGEFYHSDNVEPYTIRAYKFALEYHLVCSGGEIYEVVGQDLSEIKETVILRLKRDRANGKNFLYFGLESEVTVVPRCNQINLYSRGG